MAGQFYGQMEYILRWIHYMIKTRMSHLLITADRQDSKLNYKSVDK